MGVRYETRAIKRGKWVWFISNKETLEHSSYYYLLILDVQLFCETLVYGVCYGIRLKLL